MFIPSAHPIARCLFKGNTVSKGPCCSLVYVGFELDTANMIAQLPTNKLAGLYSLIAEWEQKKARTKQELGSLISQLHHATAVVKPGCSFLIRMSVLSNAATKL